MAPILHVTMYSEKIMENGTSYLIVIGFDNQRSALASQLLDKVLILLVE